MLTWPKRLCVLSLSLAACGGEKPPTEPEGGLAVFGAALASQDADAIWARLTPDTQLVAESALSALGTTDQLIERLQSSDQLDTREATGTGRLEELETPEALFALLVNPTTLPPLEEKSRLRAGMRAETVVQVAENTAIVVTRADQEFELVRSDDGEWRVREPVYSLLTRAAAPIHQNRARVEQAVNLFGVSAELEEELIRYGLLDG